MTTAHTRLNRLNPLDMQDDFVHRHIGLTPPQLHDILTELGLTELDDLIEQVLPTDIVNHEAFTVTDTLSENALIKRMRQLCEGNKVFTSMIGMGY